jgi:eukaryotic-like serine/threonine-protein kinase
VPSNKAEDTVIAQDPRGGMTVVKGTRVRINVSSGPAAVSVPNVIGLPFDQAAAELQDAGFSVARHDAESEEARGTVINEEPSGSAPPGSTITLTVSKGPKSSTVPDVTSQDEQSARDALQSAGFKVKVVRQDVTDPSLEGIVLDQSPPGSTQAPPNTTVTITVGKFKTPAPPPPPA